MADYEFYKEKKDYYYETKFPFFKNKLGKWVAGREIMKMMKDR